VLCAKCSNDNPGDASFCEGCGAKLELVCPTCKTLASPGARFCKKCGTALAATRPDSHPVRPSEPPIRVTADAGFAPGAIDGERKTVTALFADLKGSTALMEEMDPEVPEHPRMNKHEREQRPRDLRRSVKRGGEERMRFAGIDIGGERHAVAVVNVLGNGNLPSPRRITG
jgi:ribosomal protein L40E